MMKLKNGIHLKSGDFILKNTKVNKGNVNISRIDVKKEIELLEKDKDNEKDKAIVNGTNDISKKEIDKDEYISFDEFKKIKLKVAKVVAAQKVKGADKLLKLSLEVGNSTRNVISGIANYYQPEDIIGKSVIIVANLKPVKIRGEMSEGMILAADNGNDLVLVTPDKEIISGTM